VPSVSEALVSCNAEFGSLDIARHDARTNCSSSSPLQISNRDQIALCNRTNVALPERHESLCPSGRENELNVETIRRVNIDHCAKVSLSQPVFRQVTIENDCVE
jgi:hypothetical protein